jgi:hypothetical protein
MDAMVGGAIGTVNGLGARLAYVTGTVDQSCWRGTNISPPKTAF